MNEVRFKEIKSFCIWLTGLPCSGKTTIAKRLSEMLQNQGFEVKIFDGDEVRQTITKHLGFSKENRMENVLTVAKMAKEFITSGNDKIAICSLVSPYKDSRKKVREIFGDSFIEVFVDAPLDVCENRDIKGMYKKARMGLIKNFTGIDDPYEPPEAPEVHIKTNENDPEKSVFLVYEYLQKRFKDG